ncbi:MAG TPA: LysR family transcriptional regulator [Gammaproteobacteria bacterium]|jgi:DNA-binding transcriptional LysR family regulator
MDRLDELENLVAVISTGSLRQAATRLRRSPASVTRALASLESRLGMTLVERTTRRVVPTEAGLKMADEARDILERYGLLARGDSSAVRGLVRVTAPTVFGRLFVAPAVDSFLQRWPEASAEVLLDDRYLDFIEHQLDVAVRIGELADSGLRARRLGTIHWYTVASPAYLKAEGEPRYPAELSGRSTIAETSISGPPRWLYHIDGKDQPVLHAPRLVANDIDVQLDSARRGRGIARFLSYQAATDLSAGTLVRILRRYEPRGIPVHIVMAGGRHLRGRTRALADHLFNQIRNALADIN